MIAMNNGGENVVVVVKRGRPQAAVRDSSPLENEGALDADAREKKRRSFSRDFPVKQHGSYKCLSNVQAQTYENAVLMAEFVFEHLIRDRNMHRWNRIGEQWLQSLPYPDGIAYKDVKQYISNGYLVSRNLLAAAQSNKREWIQIGGNPKP